MKRVLVVDDEEGVREALRIYLSRFGNEVILAENGLEAKIILERDPHFHQVISDRNMPELDGMRLLEWVRENAATRHIPFAMMTGWGGRRGDDDPDAIVRECRSRGANCYSKPFNLTEMIAELHLDFQHSDR